MAGEKSPLSIDITQAHLGIWPTVKGGMTDNKPKSVAVSAKAELPHADLEQRAPVTPKAPVMRSSDLYDRNRDIRNMDNSWNSYDQLNSLDQA